MTDVKLGQVWMDTEGNKWRVVGYHAAHPADTVSLSGPLPLRGMKEIRVSTLRRNWTFHRER